MQQRYAPDFWANDSLRTETCMRVRNQKKLHQTDTCTAVLTHVKDVEKRVNVPHCGAFYTRCQPSQELCLASPCRSQQRLAEPLARAPDPLVARCLGFTSRSMASLIQHCGMCRRNGIVVRYGTADCCVRDADLTASPPSCSLRCPVLWDAYTSPPPLRCQTHSPVWALCEATRTPHMGLHNWHSGSQTERW